jgi:hypothetical protein
MRKIFSGRCLVVMLRYRITAAQNSRRKTEEKRW